MILDTLSKEERVCLLGILALCLPPHDQALGEWNVYFLQRSATLLMLEKHHWQAMQPLLYSEGNDLEIRQVQLQAFLKPFISEEEEDGGRVIEAVEEEGAEEQAAAAPPAPQAPASPARTTAEQQQQQQQQHHHRRLWRQQRRYFIVRDLLVHLACMSFYDARTRRVMVRLALDAFGVDWQAVARIEALAASHLHDIWEASHAKDKVNKGLRYAKITAAALGGGLCLP